VSARSRQEKVMQKFWCARCGSRPGERCVTFPGGTDCSSHASRWNDAKDSGLLRTPGDLSWAYRA